MIASATQVAGWFPGLDGVETEWQAAEAHIAARCSWPTTNEAGETIDPPADLVEAVRLLTARLLSRRHTVEGLTGLADSGGQTMPTVDVDLRSLLDPWRKVVLA